MDLYKAKVRLAGSPLNEVQKDNLTAAEVMILRRIHGSDAVLNVVKTGADRRDEFAERDRLLSTYGAGLAAAKASFLDMFGPESQALPRTLPGVAAAEDADDEDEDPKAHRRSARKPRGSAVEAFEQESAGADLMA